MSRTPHPMNSLPARAPERRGFIGQGLFILLPVVILSAVGLYSLRQDRVLAEAEARQTAQRYADEVARAFWTRWQAPERLRDPECLVFRVDARGEVVHPPAEPAVPTPQPLDLAELEGARREQWQTVFSAASDRVALDQSIRAAEAFLASNPPPRWAAPVHFELGQRLLAARRTNDAVQVWQTVEARYPEALTESGQPIGPLAGWKWLEAERRPARRALEVFGSNLVHRPTFLTPLLLDKAMALPSADGPVMSMVNWKEEWVWHGAVRDVAATLRAQLPARAGGVASAAGSGPVDWPPLVGVGVPGAFYTRQALGEQLRLNPQFTWRQHAANRVAGQLPVAGEAGAGAASGFGQRALFFWTRETNFFVAARLPDGAGGFWLAGQFLGPLTGGCVQPRTPAWAELEKAFPPAPPWLAVTIQVAGHAIVSDRRLQTLALRPAGKGGGQTFSVVETFLPPEILATSRQVDPGAAGAPGIELLRVHAHLVSPDLLYGRQQARTRMFGLLIGASAVAALVGFVAARRAYVRQQRLAEMQSNFVSSVSHELRAPIASVRLMAESLERGAVQEKARQHDYFRFIVQECRRLGTLIENVLDFARIDQGRKQYEQEPTDLVALVRRTAELMTPAARDKSVTLDLALPEETEWVLPVDAQALQQALINLVDNALKHSPAGSRVEVGLRGRPGVPGAEGGGAELWVEDVGPGIPAEDHERIFERFYRRGSELRRSTPGVGIGLSIVRHIVEAHGGQVRVRSAVGQGCRFTIELPDGSAPPKTGAGPEEGR